jgi:HD-GYP domain-containing protein (c-di-GMP phosphodiesterase class II)
LISKRPYKNAYSPEQALQIIKDSSGTQFDPALVEIFTKAVERLLY